MNHDAEFGQHHRVSGQYLHQYTRLVRLARYAVFQMAKAVLPRPVFAGILGLINGLRRPPAVRVLG